MPPDNVSVGPGPTVEQPASAGPAWVLRARPRLGLWFGGATAVAVIAFTLLVVRPFEQGPATVAEDVATAWNNSVSLLGILPVYPPQEDFYVGDVWAVVAESDDKPMLGQSVRIGHIDMRDDMVQENTGQPVFAETADPTNASYRGGAQFEASRRDPKDNRIALSLTAFPGVTITHTIDASAGLNSVLGGLGAKRKGSDTEEINIPVAETYGVSPVRAFGRLDELCADPQRRTWCTDEFARRILQYVANAEVIRTKDGVYVNKLQLRLVTRVFLTREIEHRRIRSDARDGQLAATPPKAGPDAAKPAAAADKPADGTAAPGKQPAGTMAYDQSNGMDMKLVQVFQRPVVFGYRAVTIELPPSPPEGATVQ